MERRAFQVPGFVMLLVVIVEAVVAAALFGVFAPQDQVLAATAVAVVGGFGFILLVSGFLVLGPNQARVIQFFGRYAGTVNTAGFHWTVPFSTKRLVSLRVGNFETARVKVSDSDGNP